MYYSIIAAISSNNVIGKNNKLPWHIPEELAHFYKIIHGKPVIMGRKTYESIGRPVENSKNYVLSHDPSLPLKLSGCTVVNNSLVDILPFSPKTRAKAHDYHTKNILNDNTEVMIIGGESIYRQFLPLANKMYLTFIDHEFDGDAYFPEWKESKWQVIDEQIPKTSLYSYRFVTLARLY